MRCPKCKTEITSVPDGGGVTICPGCNARLMTRSTAAKLAKASAADGPPASSGPHPSATLPPGTPLKKIPRPGLDTARSAGRSQPAAAPAEEWPSPATLDAVLAELQALRRAQDEILELLRSRPGGEPGPFGARPSAPEQDHDATVPPPFRTRRRKTVLLIDDDPLTREAAVAELEKAEVPVRAVADGQKGLEAIAEDKPDVIALELDLTGALAGKDVINMIKATMEWVDIPILLYTRLPVESQKEARTAHGADDLLPKASGPAALVTRVITQFRRG
jgi:CheY-like chemotaxis protein